MKSMPLSQLPWEAQLIFWILLTLVSVGFGIGTWFLIRYVNNQDDLNKRNRERFESISRKIEDLRANYQSGTDRMVRELHEVQRAALGVRQDTLEDIASIKDDVREIKTLSKAVETHQTVLKTIIIKLNNLMIIKDKKD